MHTVSQVAAMAGISVRALHHYDATGLLKPTAVGENGYRYYDRDALLRLQQILILRELGLPLAQIAAVLDDPAYDRLEALSRQRERVADQADRYSEMLRTIDRTIAELKGDRAMKDADLYSGVVDPRKQAEYEAWLIERYGPEMETRIATGRRRMDALTEDERAAMMDELKAVEEGLAEGLRRGIPADSEALDPMLARHWAWITASWDRNPPLSAYEGLADTYLAHPDFIARYERIETGFAQYLATAMKAYAERGKEQ